MEPFDRAGWSTVDYKFESLAKDYAFYTDELDHDLKQEIDKRKIDTGTFVDIGTWNGRQALHLSKIGFTVTGTDIHKGMLEHAKQNFCNTCPDFDSCPLPVTFLHDNILNTQLNTKFDYVLDRGCFHWVRDNIKTLYIENITKTVGKLMFLKVLKSRSSIEEIEKLFSESFNIISVKDTQFASGVDTLESLFVVLEPK